VHLLWWAWLAVLYGAVMGLRRWCWPGPSLPSPLVLIVPPDAAASLAEYVEGRLREVAARAWGAWAVVVPPTDPPTERMVTRLAAALGFERLAADDGRAGYRARLTPAGITVLTVVHDDTLRHRSRRH
jgi:hypothetical protein